MDLSVVVWLVLAVIGTASIAGGTVAFRGTRRTGVPALSAGAIAAGVVMSIFVLLTFPVSVSQG